MDRKMHYSIPLLLGMALTLLSALPVAADDVLTLAPQAVNERMVLTVSGPGDLIYEKTLEAGDTPVFKLFDETGERRSEGNYLWELRPAPTKSARVRGDSTPALEQKRVGPAASGSFAIVDGEFASPDVREEVSDKGLDIPTKDVLHYDDVIITGSLCVGFDCINGEDFGYSTVKLKENNLQFEFDDTSIGTFPTNNWKIQINDTTSGGASYWTLWDVDGGRRPFTMEAGAPAHSLYVEDYGRVGLGTSIPYVELHIVDGDSPTIRLDQDGSSGWAAQRWDMCGNETNFFVRDVTNGSKLPFRIQPNTPSNTLSLRSTGYVGIGTWSPSYPLHVDTLTGGTATLLGLRNNGPVKFELINTTGDTWTFNSAANGLRINANGVATTLFLLETDGDLTIEGDIVSNGTTYTPDYVFEADYPLMPLAELASFIAEEKHLPNVPSAAEVKQQGGVNLSQMQMRLLEKLEELTLYTLAQQKAIETQQSTIDELRARLAEMEQTGAVR